MKIFHCKYDSKQSMKRTGLFKKPSNDNIFMHKKLGNTRKAIIQIWKPFTFFAAIVDTLSSVGVARILNIRANKSHSEYNYVTDKKVKIIQGVYFLFYSLILVYATLVYTSGRVLLLKSKTGGDGSRASSIYRQNISSTEKYLSSTPKQLHKTFMFWKIDNHAIISEELQASSGENVSNLEFLSCVDWLDAGKRVIVFQEEDKDESFP